MDETTYNFKMIPADCTATHAIVKYDGAVFAEVPMTFALPCKEYIVIMSAIDSVFNWFSTEMVTELAGEWFGWLMAAMAGALPEADCDKFVADSQLMQKFTIDLAFKI